MAEIIQVLDAETFKDTLIEQAQKAAGAADILWLRMRGDARNMYDTASRVKAVAGTSRVVISGRADIALAAGLDGVHLNASDVPPRAVKAAFPSLFVGYSAHSPREAADSGADYATLSPVFPTSKPYSTEPLGVIDVRMLKIPVFALGGVTAGNVGQLSGRGYAGVAGISFVDELEKVRAELAGWD